MAKIVLDSVVSGYNLGKINENFQKIEDALNDEVLYRDNPPGETNTVKQDVDMDGNSIINVGDLQVGGTFTVDGINLDGVNSAFIWRGAWSNLTAYAISDAVSYDGSSYICITAHTGSTPPSVNWDLLASIGATGPTTVLSIGITDSTATGRALITAVSPATARATLEVPPRATRIDVASASTVDLTTSAPDTDDIRITGTTTITAVTVAAGRDISVTASAAHTLTNNANIVTQTGANIVCAAGDTYVLRATAANVVEVMFYSSVAAAQGSIATRQTVLNGPVGSNGLPNFGGSTGGTTVTASGTLIATSANGTANRIGSITNPSWTSLSTNGTMYLYLDIAADGTCTTGSTTLAPTYRWGGADVVTNNQFTFNIQEMVGKVGNGSVATQTDRVFVGEVTVSGSVVTAITWYALMGRYQQAWVSTLPGVATFINANHNVGCADIASKFEIQCTTADFGYVVGEIVTDTSSNAGGTASTLTSARTRNSVGYMTANSGGIYALNRTTGANALLTTTSWEYRAVAQRSW